MKILVTCFEPFGNDIENASQTAVELLPDNIGRHEIVKSIIPVSFIQAPEALRQICCEVCPDIILMTGQAARANVCLERIAINWALSAAADNDGHKATGRRIYSEAPDGIFTQISVDDLASALSGLGLPVKVSNSAGTFVCNRLYFEALYAMASTPSLFVHLPLTPRQAAIRDIQVPSLPAEASMAVLKQLIALLPVTQYLLNSSAAGRGAVL